MPHLGVLVTHIDHSVTTNGRIPMLEFIKLEALSRSATRLSFICRQLDNGYNHVCSLKIHCMTLNSVSPSSMQPISNTSQQNEKLWINKAVSVYRLVGLDGWKPHTNFGEIPETSFEFEFFQFSKKCLNLNSCIFETGQAAGMIFGERQGCGSKFSKPRISKKWATSFDNFWVKKVEESKEEEILKNFRRLTKSQSLNFKKSL